jgi:hypothetical protein
LIEPFRSYVAQVQKRQLFALALIEHYVRDQNLRRFSMGAKARRQLNGLTEQITMFLNGLASA